MNNTRFATAIHILTLLADNPAEWMSSEFIASSINVNPVIVRRELGELHEAGLVISRKGKDGGSQLARPAVEISLKEIYLMVKNSDVLGKKNLNPNPKCPIGRQINAELEILFQEMNELVSGALKDRTLADFALQFH